MNDTRHIGHSGHSDYTPERSRWIGPGLLALLILLISWAITGLLWQQAKGDANRQLQSDLERQATGVTDRIERQLHMQGLMLQSFAGFFDASDKVTKQDFHAFYQSLQQANDIRGIVGVAYIERVANIRRHVAKIRKQGQPNYHINPPGVRPVYTPIVLVEPLGGSNSLVVGYDISTVLPVRTALNQARDTGALAMSAKLTLGLDAKAPVTGVVMYVPLYRKGVAVNTPALRQTHVLGWVGTPFRTADFFSHIFPDGTKNMEVEIFDGNASSEDNLMFDSFKTHHTHTPAETRLKTVQSLVFGDHTWTLVYYALPDFGAGTVTQKPQWIAITGGLMGILLAMLAALTYNTHQRRQVRAYQRIALHQSQERAALRAQAEQALQESVWAMNEAQRIARVGTYITDIKTGLWQGSPILDDILGIDDTFIRTIPNWNNLIAPECRQELLDYYQQVIDTDGKFNKDYKVIRPADGKERWVTAQGEFTFDADGSPTFLRGTVQDVTERKLLELSLRDNEYAARLALRNANALTLELKQSKMALAAREEIYRSIVNQAADGIVMIDASTLAYIEFNDAACEALGYTRDEFSQLTLMNVQGEMSASTTGAAVAAMVKAGSSNFETQYLHRDGTLRNVHIRNRTLWKDGKAFLVGVVSDVTERKTKEQELQRYREHLEELVQQRTHALQRSVAATQRALAELEQQKQVLDQHAIVTISDTEGHMTYGNAKFTEISGYTPDEFLGQNHHLCHSGYHPKGFFKAMYDTINAGKVWRATVCNRSKNGSLYWVDSTVLAFMGENDKPIKYINVCTDVTRRQHMEDDLRASRLHFLSLIENLNDILFTLTPDGVFEYVSPQWTTIIGHDVNEVIGQFFTNFIHPEDVTICVAAMRRIFETGTTHGGIEYRVRRKDGSYLWSSANGSLIKDASTGSVKVVGIGRDINQIKCDQQALKSSMSLLNTVIESTDYGILVINNDGYVARYNQRFLDLWQIPSEILDTRMDGPLLKFAASKMMKPDQFLANVMHLYDTPDEKSDDILELADGRVFRRISRPQKMGDTVVGRVWSFDDISELKRAEKAAFAFTRVKSEFLANMSHKIRTHMSGVVGMIEIMQHTHLDDDQQRMLETIHCSSLTLLSLLNDILDYSENEADTLGIEHIPMQLLE